MELDVCAEYRIPHSEFLRWSQQDRSKAIHQYINSRTRCSGCGTMPDEWNEETGGSRFAYRAEARRCRGCQVKQGEQQSLEKQGHTGNGLYVALVKNMEGRPNG